MSFISFEFALFLPLFLWVFHLTPARWRWLLVLLASYGFYWSWTPWFLSILMGSTLVDYLAGLWLMKLKRRSVQAKSVLSLSLLFNLGMLIAFKYLGFFADIMTAWSGERFDVFRAVVLPLGISFYTFQTLSYTIDVYRGRIRAERHLGRFATFIAFFPQLLAGPIERAKDLLPQMHFQQEVTVENLTHGLRRVVWGLFKKLVIADRLAMFVNPAFRAPLDTSTEMMWLAAFFFLLQIYADFSSYSDLAVGISRMIGVKLSENFAHRVYWVHSFRGFWADWHRTMTNWFRDYVFFSLSSLRSGRVWLMLFAIVTFALNGLWHGARSTFVIWGLLNGVLMVAEQLWSPLWTRGVARHPTWMRQLLGFVVAMPLVTLMVVLFRAKSEANALEVYHTLFHATVAKGSLPWEVEHAHFKDFVFLIPALVFMDGAHWHFGKMSIEERLQTWNPALRLSAYIGLTSVILWFGVPERYEFIYFDF